MDTAIADALRRESPTMGDSTLNQTVFRALRLGVGVHHAGILPGAQAPHRELFERGLCRVVFATETMALGIHMPARSVVLQGLTKRTEHGFRSLTHNELTQMAGRAGRRGIDPEGACVIALDARDGLEDMMRVIDGSPEPVESQFKLGYGSVALLLARARARDAPPPRGVVVRPVPEPQAHPRAGARGGGAGVRGRRGQRVRCAVRRVRAYRALPARAPGSGGRRQAAGRGGRRGEREGGRGGAGRLALVRRRGAPCRA